MKMRNLALSFVVIAAARVSKRNARALFQPLVLQPCGKLPRQAVDIRIGQRFVHAHTGLALGVAGVVTRRGLGMLTRAA